MSKNFDSLTFQPIQGSEENINKLPKHNGYLYFAYDTGNIYLDRNNDRFLMGSSSSGFFWCNGSSADIIKAESSDTTDTTYIISMGALEGDSLPKKDSLILNADGRFFRVKLLDKLNEQIYADLIAVSGNGSGGGGGSTSIRDINLTWDERTIKEGSVYVADQQIFAFFTPFSDVDRTCSLTFTYIDVATGATDTKTVNGLPSGQKYKFDTSWLPISNNLTLRVTVKSANSEYKEGQGWTRNFNNIKVVEMKIQKDLTQRSYTPIIKPNEVSREQFFDYKIFADPSIIVVQHVYIDDDEVSSLRTNIPTSYYNGISSYTAVIPDPGVHKNCKITIKVSTKINELDVYSTPIEYEAAWARPGNDEAIIWVGGYDTEIVNYETSYIKFMVYDPQQDQPGQQNIAHITLYKENVEVGQMDVPYSALDWAQWDISDIYTIGENNFSIACRGAKVDIQLNVTTKGARQLDIEAQSLLMRNYSASGRSNNEVQSQRIKWTDRKNNVDAILTGFNWKNNGWNNDGKDAKTGIDNGSYLTVANGAHVTFPFNTQISMNYSDNYTFEFRFRIRNIQKYSTLVKTYAKYYINVGTDENPVQSESSYTQKQIVDNNYKYYYDQYGSPLMDDNVVKEYEKEEGIVIKWMDGDNGICIGTQEAYFASPREVVSVRYKEDEVINLSVVVSTTDGLAYIYLNGIASGAAALPLKGDPNSAFSIKNNFEVNSDYCDIDLYRMRIYQTGLSMPQIIHNYLSDIHSIKLYDQNQLTSQPTKLSYDLLVQYNKDHPDEVTMPYAVWKIISDNTKQGDNGETWSEILPYYKGNKCVCECTFVNTSLDQALENKEIDEWYYYTHSPSYRAVGVEIDVQGTSSQGYPRRNYKTKFKAAAPSDEHPDYGWFYTKGSLAGKRVDKEWTVLQTKNNQGKNLDAPIEKIIKKKWHMDNESLGTNKFTWKIDYMESSGTYNTGYANLMGNTQHPLYTKHPLDFYNINGLSTTGLRTTVYGFPVLVFHEYANTLMNISEAGAQYEYIGRYNLNLDKSSNEYYGFELEKEQPFIDSEWDEMGERDVIDPETGEPKKDGDGNTITEQYIKAHHNHPWISQIAECWELEDNQGTWCSFKYPNTDARQTGFHTLQTGYNDRLECMLHYEYRYSYYGDQLDAIGADGHYDGTAKDRAKYASQIGTTHLEMSNYAYERYKNLEALFNWLDSTDQDAATNANLTTPLTIQTPHAYSGQGESSEPVYGYAIADIFDSQQTYYTLEEGNYVLTDDFARDENDYIIGFKEGKTYYISKILHYTTTFNKDSAGYRLEKFRREFDQHLNKEYCLIYFIMTELLLCYDSRGKNMMLATFGPQETGGNYIWFPIFYDIDTQLGLNNSGAYLWDYDADVTADGLFSTPTSVLWVNLWAAFPEEIMSQYRVLRGLNDGTNVVGSLSYENISGAYTCDPTVFDSYAMRGVRPIIAIGLDEYYKYFATTAASGVGWFTQTGQHQKDATADYAYACQGDKILTTELLIRNRLNYIDSWWQGGDYHINKVKGSQLQCRVSGNRKNLTSDTYLEVDSPPDGFTYAKYPKDYFDAQPGFKLKPFLKQYISFFTDEVAGEVIKYTGESGQEDGLRTPVPAATITAYKTTPETPNEQLNYIPGVDYLSSLGDLSTSYISEFTINRGKRLLDITLGSDIPGYKNEMIKSNTIFNLHCGKDDDGKKPLLQKMILTGLTNLDKTIDISGSAKLQEFRALNTNIPNVYFAEGAPIHTIHLPSSIKSISISQDKELKNILTSRPIICTLNNEGQAVYADPLTYRGLYIEGLTDATIQGTDHTVSSININGGGMGYSSYELLEKLVLVKTGTQSKVNIGMIDVEWTPYTQVEYGETYDSNKASIYKILNSHGTYDNYTYEPTTWNSDTLNGVIYTYDETAAINTIQDLSLFDRFITEYEADKELGRQSQFQQLELTGEASLPTITGNLYINNSEDNKIPEADLTEVYEKYFPNLTITAAYVNTSYLIKYIRIQDNGKIETLDIKRTNDINTKLFPTCLPPSKTYYDFAGWSTQNPNENSEPEIVLQWDRNNNQYVETEAWNNLQYDVSTKELTLYAIFTPQIYTITYRHMDGTLIEIVESPYSTEMGSIKLPSEVPSLDESSLPLEETYVFLGYSTESDGDIIDLSKRYSDRSMTLYAIFEKALVRETDYTEYFEIDRVMDYIDPVDNRYNIQNGICLRPVGKTVKEIAGKILVPAFWGEDEIPVIGISNFTRQPRITHIFFESDNELRFIDSNCCTEMTNLSYFDFEKLTKLREIKNRAFSFIENLSLVDSIGDPETSILYRLGTAAFMAAFGSPENSPRSSSLNLIRFPSSIKYIGQYGFAFSSLNDHEVSLQIGTENKPSELELPISGITGNDISELELFGSNTGSTWDHIDFYTAKYNGNVVVATADYSYYSFNEETGEEERIIEPRDYKVIDYFGLLRNSRQAMPNIFTIYYGQSSIYTIIDEEHGYIDSN